MDVFISSKAPICSDILHGVTLSFNEQAMQQLIETSTRFPFYNLYISAFRLKLESEKKTEEMIEKYTSSWKRYLFLEILHFSNNFSLSIIFWRRYFFKVISYIFISMLRSLFYVSVSERDEGLGVVDALDTTAFTYFTLREIHHSR